MNKFVTAIFAVSAFFGAALEAAENPTVTGTVNADLLNLRLSPGLQSPVVGKAVEKSELKIRRVTGNWLEVEAPETLKIYVSEARVGRDGVLSGELNMRSAMDVSAPCLGTLPKGTKVEKMDERRNGWVRIKLPATADVKVYAASFLVNYDSSKFDENGYVIGAKALAPAEKVGKAPEKAAETPAAVPAVPAANAPEKVEAPAEKVPEKTPEKTVEAPAVQLENAELSGVLIKWKYAVSRETGYAVLSSSEGFNKGFVFCDDEALLAANVEKKVRIVGKKVGNFGEKGVIIVKAESITEL